MESRNSVEKEKDHNRSTFHQTQLLDKDPTKRESMPFMKTYQNKKSLFEKRDKSVGNVPGDLLGPHMVNRIPMKTSH